MAGALLAAPQAATHAAEPLRLPKKVRLALIGMEGHTGEILGRLKQLPDVELVALCDSDAKAMAAVARRYAPSARQYSDYRRLLDQEKPDMAGVCGPNGTRAEIVLACAARKIHVVAEKPLTTERADLERIRKAVAAQNIRLSMLLPMRFYPVYLAMRQVVQSGEIGEVAQIGAQKSYKLGERPEWMRHHGSFGGTIPYIGVHMVDLMRFTSGRELTETVAFQSRVGFPDLQDMENTTSTLFHLDNGGTAALRMDYLRPQTAPTHGDDRLRLAGTRGVLEYQESTGLTLVTDNSKPHVISDLPPAQWLFPDFLASVYLGKAVGLDLADIYRVNEIVLAARESAEQRRILKT